MQFAQIFLFYVYFFLFVLFAFQNSLCWWLSSRHASVCNMHGYFVITFCCCFLFRFSVRQYKLKYYCQVKLLHINGLHVPIHPYTQNAIFIYFWNCISKCFSTKFFFFIRSFFRFLSSLLCFSYCCAVCYFFAPFNEFKSSNIYVINTYRFYFILLHMYLLAL